MGTEFYQDFKEVLAHYGLSVVAIILIIAALFFTDKIKIWAGWIEYWGSYVFHGLRKSSIKNRLEGSCSRALKQIGKELPDLQIPDLSIEWVKDDNYLTKLKEGKAIVKLKFSTDQTRNIVNATSLYVRDAFLIHAKPYLSLPLRKSIDFSITRKILLQIDKNQRNVISHFIEEFSSDILPHKEKYSQIEELDNAGFLTRILIREFDYFGNKLSGLIPKDENYAESDAFLNFLYDIATREHDEYTQLQFINKTIKVGVLLVAKPETYLAYGLEAYLRRIRLGLARGIKTFYLLAREDKVEILENVATELLATGNFTLINKPKEFDDKYGRSVICYCLRIDKESSMAKAYDDINESIETKNSVKGVITKVRTDEIKVNVNGVEGFVRKANLSSVYINETHKYFTESMHIELVPLEILKDGLVEFTLVGTKSDPYNIVSSNFEIGKKVKGIVKYCDDDFIKLDLGNSIEGISFRSDLTFSKYIFLHEKYRIGTEHEFIIKDISVERNSIHLTASDLHDPWNKFIGLRNKPVDMIVYKKNHKVFVGELDEGIEAILPYTELTWFDNEADSVKSTIKVGQTLICFVKETIKDKRIVYVSLCNPKQNPYVQFLDVNRNKIVECFLTEQNTFGISGIIENKYKLFIPNGEQSRGYLKHNYKLNDKNQVEIIDVNNRLNSIVGSFKPLISYPLQDFANKFSEGQILKSLKRKNSFEEGATFEIKDNNKTYEAILFRGEISNICFIESCKNIFKDIDGFPLVIKRIDLEKDKIFLSLKDILILNKKRTTEMKYSDSYQSVILGKVKSDYVVLLKGIWVEGILETPNIYRPGDIVNVRPSKISGDPIVLTIDE